MTYNFDEVIDRRNSNCLKYDFKAERGRAEDELPLWIADMDFRTPPCVIEHLRRDLDLGIFGYSEGKSDYFQAVKEWFFKKFAWSMQEDWLIKTPGIIFAIAVAIHAFTKEGEGIIIQSPVYYPFQELIRKNKRELVNSPLVLKDGHYEIDFDDFEKKIIKHKVKLFILCSPHNPVGRIWTLPELTKLGEICLRHQVLVVSDEIHCDFTYGDKKHTVFASISKETENIAITCTSPGKTFNLAGLQISNIFIANEYLRKQFKETLAKMGYSQASMPGISACKAAYEEGEEWLNQLITYLEGNLDFVREYIKNNLSKIKLIEPEGTYLIWLDFRGLGINEKEQENLIKNHAKLWLDAGSMFGEGGAGFERINIACPRSILEEALERLKKALENYDYALRE